MQDQASSLPEQYRASLPTGPDVKHRWLIRRLVGGWVALGPTSCTAPRCPPARTSSTGGGWGCWSQCFDFTMNLEISIATIATHRDPRNLCAFVSSSYGGWEAPDVMHRVPRRGGGGIVGRGA